MLRKLQEGHQETGMNEAGKNQGGGMGKAAAWHPIPTRLVDEVMPRLRDTELRVLLVVVRQTLGWQEGPDPMHRKERDWLTQSQLMRRTGRASAAVARAVDALVRDGLIEVLDRAGTPAGRRRRNGAAISGRLYYRLSPHSLSPAGKRGPRFCSAQRRSGTAQKRTRKSEYDKRKQIQKYKQGPLRIVDKPVENPLVIRGGWFKAGSDAGPASFMSRSDSSARKISSPTLDSPVLPVLSSRNPITSNRITKTTQKKNTTEEEAPCTSRSSA